MKSMQSCRLLVIGVVTATLISRAVAQDRQPVPESRISAPGHVAHAESLSQAFRAAADKVLPSVVKIRTETKGRSDMAVMLQGFGLRGLEVPDQRGLGSGVIIDSSGIILTNNHVVQSADEVVVELSDGTELYATDYTTDPLTDLAIVRVRSANSLPAAQFGDSDSLQIGDWVLAVGHPLELETSVSAGIISAKGRALSKVERASFLQTDAAINPGNSGGPLVNLDGEVVGINTAIASQTGGYQGIGFAIPGSLAREVADQLKQKGLVKRGYLGVGIQKLTGDLAGQLADNPSVHGVVVSQVGSGTPADQAGIEPGDVITHFAGRPVATQSELQRAVERVPIGSTQPIRLIRFGRPLTKRVTTFEYNAGENGRSQYRELRQPLRGNESLGMEVEDISVLARQYGVEADTEGVIVISVDRDGLAAEEGIRPRMSNLAGARHSDPYGGSVRGCNPAGVARTWRFAARPYPWAQRPVRRSVRCVEDTLLGSEPPILGKPKDRHTFDVRT